jgi:hypothetical protein
MAGMSAASDLIGAPRSSHGAASRQFGGSGAATSPRVMSTRDSGILPRGSFISGHLVEGYMQNFRQAA